MERAEHSSAFSALATAKAKIILLGQSEPRTAELISQARSFPIEHVSPASLVQQEISRRTPLGQQVAAGVAHSTTGRNADQILLAALRKWFWARKPDAGYLLEGYPATLLQAKVLDEWIEARGETLTGVFAGSLPDSDPVVAHYRTQGLLLEIPRAAA